MHGARPLLHRFCYELQLDSVMKNARCFSFEQDRCCSKRCYWTPHFLQCEGQHACDYIAIHLGCPLSYRCHRDSRYTAAGIREEQYRRIGQSPERRIGCLRRMGRSLVRARVRCLGFNSGFVLRSRMALNPLSWACQ